MARRQRNRSALAGLAALGALGYISGKGPLAGLYTRREGASAPVQDGATPSQAAVSSDYQPSTGFMEQGFYSPAPSPDYVPLGAGNMEAGFYGPEADTAGLGRSSVEAAPAGSLGSIIQGGAQAGAGAPAPRTRSLSGQGAGAGAGAGVSAVANRADLRGYDDMYANRPAAAPVIGPRDTGRGGATAAELDAYERSQRSEAQRGRGYNRAESANNEAMRGRGYNRANATTPAPQRNLTREEAISAIPGQSALAPQGGQRVSGNEVTRNLSNIAMGLGPTRLAGFGNAAVEGATARAAAQRAALLRAERAEAARRGQTPTTFTSTRPSEATKRTRKFNEEDSGVEFKRGGKTKKMASGGMTSASKRGDGIASKGKTKCKMY